MEGRYREFTQAGIEILGPSPEKYQDEAEEVLRGLLDSFKLDYRFCPSVKRGLSYYVDNGFEVEVDSLGAQKQVAGGGRYEQRVGWNTLAWTD